MELQHLLQNFFILLKQTQMMGTQAQVFPTVTEFSSGLNASIFVVPNTDSFTQCAGRQSTHKVKILDFMSCLWREQVLGGESIKLQYARCSFLYTMNNQKMAFPIYVITCVVIGFAFSCLCVKTQCTFVLLCTLWKSGLCEQGVLQPMNRYFTEFTWWAQCWSKVAIGVIVWFFVSSCSCFLCHGSWFLQVYFSCTVSWCLISTVVPAPSLPLCSLD